MGQSLAVDSDVPRDQDGDRRVRDRTTYCWMRKKLPTMETTRPINPSPGS
jgi:hypothetical protein